MSCQLGLPSYLFMQFVDSAYSVVKAQRELQNGALCRGAILAFEHMASS